jgi:hypothetical protein
MVASCWLLLYDLYYDAQNREHLVYKHPNCRAYQPFFSGYRGVMYLGIKHQLTNHLNLPPRLQTCGLSPEFVFVTRC